MLPEPILSFRNRVVAVAAAVVLIAGACGGGETAEPQPIATPTEDPELNQLPPSAEDEEASREPAEIDGVLVVPFEGGGHTPDPVTYSSSPPAGGDHNPGWQNCGFYTVEVPNEQAVHSLEHGAVWVTYGPAANEAELATLEALASTETHLLVTPYSDQETPYALTAWGRQAPLESIDDPLFQEFLDTYMGTGPTAPEPGATCQQAYGIPPDDTQTINR